MPIYEFICNDCENKFEELVFGNPTSVKCPKCSGENTKKLMSVCRSKVSGGDFPLGASSSTSGGGCSGCSGGSCATCGG